MRVLLLIALSLSFASCAFKASEATPAENGVASPQNPQAPQGNTLSYSIPSDDKNKENPTQPITASVSLGRDASSNQLKSDYALVLPQAAPETLIVELKIMDRATPITSMRGTIFSGEKVIREIPATAFFIERGQRSSMFIKFSLGDIKLLFPSDSQAEIGVTLVSTDESGRSAQELSFMLSTPPSKTSAEGYFPLDTFEKKTKTSIPDSVKHVITDDGQQLELRGLFVVKNSEAAPIDVEIPAHLSHTLDLVEHHIQVSKSDCASTLSKTATTKRLVSDLWLFPLISSQVNTSLMTVRIPQNEVAHIGVYAASVGGLVPPENHLVSENLPVKCMAQCKSGAEGDWNDRGRWGWDCLYCGNSPDNQGEGCYNCMKQHRNWCKWENWKDWKEYAVLATGLEYSLTLSPAADSDTASNRFAAKFLGQSVPGRPHKLLTESVTIKR